MTKTLIKNAWLVTLDPDLGDLTDGDILIENGRITEIASGIVADAEVVDARNTIAIPGFVDTHRHTWESLLRGVGADWSLNHYFQVIRGVAGWHYRPEDVYAGNLLGVLESLEAGITTLLDWSHLTNTPEHADAAIAALKASGSRSVFAYGNSNREWIPMSDQPHSHDVERIQSEYFSSADQLLTLALAVRGPEYTTLDVTEHDYKLARRLGLRISVHAGSGLEGHRFRPLIKLRDLGLLGPDVTYIHANTLTDEEFRLLADSGGTVSMSPEIEMHMGHGLPCTGKVLEVGVRPSLSIDVVTTVGGGMFGAMRAALAAERCRLHMLSWELGESLAELPLTARDVLEFATIEGARACGLDHRVGTLTPGKDADIVLIAANRFGMLPLNDAVGTVVTQAQPGDVDSVFVAGRAVKRDGRMVEVDGLAVERMVTESRDYLYSRAAVPHGGRWIDYAPRDVAAGPPSDTDEAQIGEAL